MKQPFCAPSEALRRVLDAAAALPRPETETVPLDEAGGRIAAGTLSARMDQPPLTAALRRLRPAQRRRRRCQPRNTRHPARDHEALRRRCPRFASACGLCGPHHDRRTPARGRRLCADAGADRQRRGDGTALCRHEAAAERGIPGRDIAAGAVIAESRYGTLPAHLGVLAGQGYAEVPRLQDADRGRSGHRKRAF